MIKARELLKNKIKEEAARVKEIRDSAKRDIAGGKDAVECCRTKNFSKNNKLRLWLLIYGFIRNKTYAEIEGHTYPSYCLAYDICSEFLHAIDDGCREVAYFIPTRNMIYIWLRLPKRPSEIASLFFEDNREFVKLLEKVSATEDAEAFVKTIIKIEGKQNER